MPKLLTALAGLCFAVLLDVLMGDPPNRMHPVAAMGTYIRWLSRIWNKGSTKHRFISGFLLILSGIVVLLSLLIVAQIGLSLFPLWLQVAFTGLFLKPVFSFRNLISAGQQVKAALEKNDIIEARHLTSWHLVSRDTHQLSEKHVSSAVIESLSENLTDSFFAPLFYFAIGGLPLAWAYRFINTADAMIAYHNEEFEYFGKSAARIDDVLNWLPARLSALMIILSAVLTRMNWQNAYKTTVNDHGKTSSPNAGWTMSAAAGALNVVLEKLGHYQLVGGSELPDTEAINRSLRLIRTAFWISVLFCGGLIYAIHLAI